MRKIFAAFALLLGSLSLASPAQDLFDQASFYIEFYYNGPSTKNLKELTVKYQKSLDQACTSDKEKCAYDKAVPIIQEMIDELEDGHTYYQTPEDLGRTSQTRQGQVPSRVLRIGLTHRAIEGSRDRLVMDVVEGGPASEAGIQYGDRIIAINGRNLSEFSSDDQAVQFLTQQVQTGQPVTVTVLRGPKRERLELRMTGREINLSRLPSLRFLPGDVAVLRIPEFFPEGQVGRRVHQLVKQAQERGAKAMILELRGNGGGSALESLLSMAAFVDNPSVTFTDRYETQRITYAIEGEKGTIKNGKGTVLNRFDVTNYARWKGPLVILVDEGSASGAEYMASALQLAGAGKVIGSPTVGIGNTTTRTFDLINGGGINISYNRAFFANGNSYPSQVKPDVASSLDIVTLANQGLDVVIEKALEILGIKTAYIPGFYVQQPTHWAVQ